jgi:hypothetical protein
MRLVRVILLRLWLRLTGLHGLLLGRVLIGHLLRLLLVLLLHLPGLGVAWLLLIYLLMFGVLLLLEALAFLVLSGNQVVLLLLILLVRFGVS